MAEQFAVIEFEEYPDEWFRVRLSPVSLRDFEQVVDAYNAAARSGLLPGPMHALIGRIMPLVESWSRGEPINADSLAGLDLNLILALAGAWIKGVREVPLPLPRRSSDGDTSEDPETSPTSST